jgi:cytochrome c biogenesis protein CcmG/thiol:disulfide interchange protein DsbE
MSSDPGGWERAVPVLDAASVGESSVGESAVPGVGGLTRPRSRVVLWSCLAAAAVLGLLVAVMASASPASNGGSASLLVGRQAPPIEGRTIDGPGRASLAQLSGKWVVVNFAASWCVPCRQETPQLEEFVRQHGSAGNATVLGVAEDPTDLANLASYMKSAGATWPVVDDGSAVVSYGVSELPHSYLVDPEGKVVASYLGPVTARQLDEAITRLPRA